MKTKLIHILFWMLLVVLLASIANPQEPVQDTLKTKAATPDSLKVDTLTRGYTNQLEQFKKATPKKDKK